MRSRQITSAAVGSCCWPGSNARELLSTFQLLEPIAAVHSHDRRFRAAARPSDELSLSAHDVRQPSGAYP